jgi:hypothetical protein
VSISTVVPIGLVERATARSPVLALPILPQIEPGQLWLIELATARDPPAAPLRQAIDQANVVIYDRAFADFVAASLPLGNYAEPAASTDEAGDPAAARAVRFACDGWSVARLVPPHPTQRERIVRVRRLVEELAATKAPGDVPVTVVGELADGVFEPTETRLDRLDLVVVTYPRDARLTIVVGDGLAG